MKRRFLPVLFLLSGFTALLTSCYTDQKLGKRFVRMTAQDAPAVWFIGASYLFHACNLENDSLQADCRMLATLQDSAVLENYNRQFARQLEAYGYQVFTFDESEQFFNQKGLGLIVNIAQLEMEEVQEFYTQSEIFDSLKYTESTPVRVVKFNSWIEVSLVDTTKAKHELFFTTNRMSDLIDGHFTQNEFRGDVTYHYKRYDMKPVLMSKFVSTAGKEHAQRLFDLWMNRYIQMNLDLTDEASRINAIFYFHYNPERKRMEVIEYSEQLQKL